MVLGHTLYDAEEITKKGKGKVPYTYGPFMKILDSLPKPAKPIPAPKALPDPGPTDLKGWKRADHDVEKWRKRDVNQESRNPSKTERDQSYESFAGPEGNFGVPTMEELGMEATGQIRGGETEGLKRFEEYMKQESTVANFRKPQTSPAQFDPPASECSKEVEIEWEGKTIAADLVSFNSNAVVPASQIRHAFVPLVLPQSHGH